MLAVEFEGSGPRSPVGVRFFAVFLVGALLACHGVLGAFHLLPDSQAAAMKVEAGQQDAAEAREGSGGCPADDGYFAVLPMVLLLGVALVSLLRSARARHGSVRSAFSVIRAKRSVVGFARGGSRHIVLQVFRL
jgi:hypothetical protein